MKHDMMKRLFLLSATVLLMSGRGEAKTPRYNIYLGNTHAHCNYSGDILRKAETKGEPVDPNNVPDRMFAQARACGYDFYAITDHSQYECYSDEAVADIRRCAAEASVDGTFAALCGFEFSRNSNTDGKGHINVYNTPSFLSAEYKGMADLQSWLLLPENSSAVACFNHPEPNSYNNFACYEEESRGRFAMIELINGKNARYYERFLTALSKGWRVSPVAGCDNHRFQNIAGWKARTGVAAESLTPESLVEAFIARRTYATFDKRLKIMYYVNNQPMGSVIRSHGRKLKFDIRMSTEAHIISKVEIAGADGRTLLAKTFDSNHVTWKPSLPDTEDYCFLLVYEDGSDEPVAWVAPVWIER